MLNKWTTFTGRDITKQINPALGLSLQIHISFGHTLTYMQHAEWEIKIIDLKQSCFVNCYSEHNECKLHRKSKIAQGKNKGCFTSLLLFNPLIYPSISPTGKEQPFWSPANVVFWMLLCSTGLLQFLNQPNKTKQQKEIHSLIQALLRLD